MNFVYKLIKEGRFIIFPLFVLLIFLVSLFYFNETINDEIKNKIILNIRLPRLLTSILVGSSLSLVGYIYQSVLRNPLADPYILGVSSGSAGAIAIYLFFSSTSISVFYLQSASYIGAIFVILFFYLLLKMLPNYNLVIILIGVGLAYFFSSLISFIVSMMEANKLIMMNTWLIGNIDQAEIFELTPLSIIFFITIIFSIFNSKILDALNIGEDFSTSSGINTKFFTIMFLILASLLTAASVSVVGTIGFVGLVVPHFTSMMLKNKKYKIIFVSIFGAVFLSLCNALSIIFNDQYSIPVGVFSSFIGAPFLIFLIFRKYNARTL